MRFIDGGVTAAKGFRAAGAHIGIRKNHSKRDVALILSDYPAVAACMYTQNLVQGAPIAVTREHVANGAARAIICNSGNANTCNHNGREIAEGMCALAAGELGIDASDIIVASTGVIGQEMSLEPFEKGMKALCAALGDGAQAASDAAEAMMTTDTVKKQAAVSVTLNGKEFVIGGASKGCGMICPNMATMLCFITTDAAVSLAALKAALKAAVENTFNMLSVDGDTSTNDMITVLANGRSGIPEINEGGPEYEAFAAALGAVCEALCRMMARDGEGATKLLTCKCTGAKDDITARTAAKAVIKSSLFKAAMFGADANWGRVLCAIGYSGADVDINKIGVSFASTAGEICVCSAGHGVPFSEDEAKRVLSEDEIDINISLGDGEGRAVAWGCDLTYDYVKINGDYRT